MLPDLGAAYERYCEAIEDAKEAAADAAEHFSIEAHKELMADFMAAAKLGAMTTIRVPCDKPRQESVAQLLLEEIDPAQFAVLLAMARDSNPAAVDKWLAIYAERYADKWSEERGAELESAARAAAADDFAEGD